MNSLSGHTHPFAVLGHPIGHTLSPVMHNASFAAQQRDAIYLAFDVHPDRLLHVLPAMRDMGFRGVNLTVPLKEVAFAGFMELDDSARLVGAVNTVAFTPKGLVGHNTDGYGYLKAMEEAFGPSVQGESLFVLGTGGAGRALALVSAKQSASAITLADMDGARAERVAAEIRSVNPTIPVSTVETGQHAEAARCADVILQCSPVGMKASDPSLLPAAAFRKGQKVLDLVYMYPETAFLQTARTAGARVANGLGMLLHQGARSFTLWTGEEPSVDAMRLALEKAVYNG